MRSDHISRWVRVSAIGFAALALAATAFELSREGSGFTAPTSSGSARDPLAGELERCNATVPTDPRYEACERAWAENRRRFLGMSASTGGQP